LSEKYSEILKRITSAETKKNKAKNSVSMKQMNI
jgi:hypothetical protein